VRCEDDDEHCPICLQLQNDIAQLQPCDKKRLQKEGLLMAHKQDVATQYHYSMYLQVL
jgi:hypothetical protein